MLAQIEVSVVALEKFKYKKVCLIDYRDIHSC